MCVCAPYECERAGLWIARPTLGRRYRDNDEPNSSVATVALIRSLYTHFYPPQNDQNRTGIASTEDPAATGKINKKKAKANQLSQSNCAIDSTLLHCAFFQTAVVPGTLVSVKNYATEATFETKVRAVSAPCGVGNLLTLSAVFFCAPTVSHHYRTLSASYFFHHPLSTLSLLINAPPLCSPSNCTT